MSVFAALRTAVARRTAYRRTLRAIEALPPEVALDLGILREDAARIAARAVYGR